MKEIEKIKIEDKQYKKIKKKLFDFYFVQSLTITEIKKLLNITTSRVKFFIFRLKNDFFNIIKTNDYYLMWCDNEYYPTAKSFGIKGYSNEYKKFTYRLLNYKQLNN